MLQILQGSKFKLKTQARDSLSHLCILTVYLFEFYANLMCHFADTELDKQGSKCTLGWNNDRRCNKSVTVHKTLSASCCCQFF